MHLEIQQYRISIKFNEYVLLLHADAFIFSNNNGSKFIFAIKTLTETVNKSITQMKPKKKKTSLFLSEHLTCTICHSATDQLILYIWMRMQYCSNCTIFFFFWCELCVVLFVFCYVVYIHGTWVFEIQLIDRHKPIIGSKASKLV